MTIDWQTIDIRSLAGLISETLRVGGIDSILVGGACVSIYTENRYQSFDLDFVTHETIKTITPVLARIGFLRRKSRYFVNPQCPFYVEFVAPPAAVGDEPLTGRQKLETRFGEVVLLTATDCVKDRLSAYYHWSDPQALEQAVMVAWAQEVDLRDVERWSAKEGFLRKYLEFSKEVSRD